MMSAAEMTFDSLQLANLKDTELAATRFARAARPGDVIALYGDLGAGKTAFARAFISTLMGEPTEVPSPTFTMVQTYDTPHGTIWHFDLYRLEGAEEVAELGFEDALSEGITLIEWPERLGLQLPDNHLALTLAIAEDGVTRTLSITQTGDWSIRLKGPAAQSLRAEALRQFISDADWANAQRLPLAGDASFRRYERLRRAKGETVVLMDAAPPREDVRPFLNIQRYLQIHGYSAPQVLACDEAQGFMILEDLGDNLFSRAIPLGAPERQLYESAVDLLVNLHRQPLPSNVPSYGEMELQSAPDNVVDWYLPALTGMPTPETTRKEFSQLWRQALAQAQGFPSVLVLRDYHADNLLWLPERAGLRQIGLLDFQDAALGHPAYDLVSALQDARRNVVPELEEELLSRYLAATGFDETAFRRAYAVVGAARNSRILGLWPRLWTRDGKPQYLRFLPRTWDVLERNLAHPALKDLKAWYEHHIPTSKRLAPLPGAPQ